MASESADMKITAAPIHNLRCAWQCVSRSAPPLGPKLTGRGPRHPTCTTLTTSITISQSSPRLLLLYITKVQICIFQPILLKSQPWFSEKNMDVEEGGGAVKKQDMKELAANEYAHTAPLTTPVEQCFDWARELPDLIATPAGTRLEFYIVMFRSIRKASANSAQLYAADAAAHDEARLSGGLLKYWYGTLNERRECLAMCIWASREEAAKAMHKPAHREAMKLAPVMYETYTLERYALRIDPLLLHRPSFTLLGSMSST